MYLQLEGDFGSKLGPKSVPIKQNLRSSDRIELLTAFNLSRQVNHFGVVERQNQIKTGRVMPIQSWGKSGVLAYFCAEN